MFENLKKNLKKIHSRNQLPWALFMLTISVTCTVLCFSGVIVAFVYSTNFAEGLGSAIFPMFLAGINMVALVANVERIAQLSTDK